MGWRRRRRRWMAASEADDPKVASEAVASEAAKANARSHVKASEAGRARQSAEGARQTRSAVNFRKYIIIYFK